MGSNMMHRTIDTRKVSPIDRQVEAGYSRLADWQIGRLPIRL